MFRNSPSNKPAGAVSAAKVVESSQTSTRQSSGTGTNAAPSSRRASFLAYLAERHFELDLSVALVLPLVLLCSIAWSLDPRVDGAGRSQGQRGCSLPPWAAKPDFPCGAGIATQVLHVARHLLWYTLVRPARLGDWAGMELNAQVLLLSAVLLLLAACPRRGRLWALWRRWRVVIIATTSLCARGLLMVPSFLLRPPHTWPTHSWSRYVISASTSPLLNALMLGLLDQVFKLPVLETSVLAAIQTAAAFFLSYNVAPTILTLHAQQSVREQQRQQGLYGSQQASAPCYQLPEPPVPLQCGGGLHPEHSALLSCRPLMTQVLLGLAMVAWPVWLSWAVDRSLQRAFRAAYGSWPQQQQQQQQGRKEHVLQHLRVVPLYPQRVGKLDKLHERYIAPSGGAARPAQLHTNGHVARSLGAKGTTRPMGRYMGVTEDVLLSLKVLNHPGTFEEYSSRLAAAAPNLAAAAVSTDQPTSTRKDQMPTVLPLAAAPSQAVVRAPSSSVAMRFVVVRGCVQVIAWSRRLRAAKGDARAVQCAAKGAAAEMQTRLRVLTAALPELLPGAAEGAVGGVSVQVGQAAAMGVPVLAVDETAARPDGGESASRLLMLCPAALAVPGIVSGDGTEVQAAVRLLLHSPRPQLSRVLVLAEGEGDGEHSRARLLCELAVELVGGPQEVEVALGPGELEGAVGADGVGVLQLVLVGPEHNTVGGGDAAYPLVHFVAPPLLVLPPAAAEEVCGLWRALRKEAGLVAGSAGEASRPAQAAERQSSLWWSHLAPLLGDLAYVLGAGADGTDAKRVASHLLPYLYDTCMGELVGLVQCRTGAAGGSCSVQPQQAAGGSGAAGGSAGGSGVISGSGVIPSGVPTTVPVPALASRAPGPLPVGSNLLLPLSRPFSPPPLEAAYQAWRLAGLAAAAPYVLLMGIAKTATDDGLHHAMRMAPLAALNWISNSAPNLALLPLSAARCRAAGRPPAALPPPALEAAFRWYALARVLLGPGVWLAASIAVSLGVVPSFDAYVGNDRIVLLSFVQRALVLPCVQRMPVRQARTASPLLAAGEVLQLAALQPTWGWQLLLCHVALWRSGALAAAAVLEFWSRRRYAGVLRRQQAAGELSQHGSGGGSNAGLDNKDKQA